MSESKHKIAVLGPKEMISGFKALGAEVFEANDGETARDLIKELKKPDNEPQDYAIIFVTSSVLNRIPQEDYAKLVRGALPAVTSIPDITGSDTVSSEKLKKLTERALGSDILS